MASTPTTKSQVQAYKFVLRRMQHALVRKDAVMLHDPLRTQSRATAVGVIVAAVGMLGFMIFGILKPAAPPPSEGIVIGKESGQIYVKVAATENTPEMLIPTFNLASARLILMGRTQSAAAAGGGPQGGAAAPQEAVKPEIVPDDRLKDIPRGNWQGIQNGPPLLPTEEQRVSDNWAVCDYIQHDPDLNETEALAQAKLETAVIAGVSNLGQPLGKDQAILAKRPGDGKTFLIYRPKEDPNRTTNMVAAEVDLNNVAIKDSLGLNVTPRTISLGLLDAIEHVNALAPPAFEGKGEPIQANLGGEVSKIGDVFKVDRGGEFEFYAVVKKDGQVGKQEISEAVASMIRSVDAGTVAEVPLVSPDLIAQLPQLNAVEVADYPNKRPNLLEQIPFPTTCLGWTITGEGEAQDAKTTVFVGVGFPIPRDENGTRKPMMKVAKPDASGKKLDQFYMPPGHAAAVHAATSKDSFNSGPIYLIDDHGLLYGIPDVGTASALGLTKLRPAPQSIVGLLPMGTSLNTQAAQQTYGGAEEDSAATGAPEGQQAGG